MRPTGLLVATHWFFFYFFILYLLMTTQIRDKLSSRMEHFSGKVICFVIWWSCTIFPILPCTIADIIPHQTPKNIMMGLLGMSLSLEFVFLGKLIAIDYPTIASLIFIISLWLIGFSYYYFACGKKTHLEWDTDDVAVNWNRFFLIFLALLPMSLINTKCFYFDATTHLGALYFYMEACQTRRIDKFQRFRTKGRLYCFGYRESVRRLDPQDWVFVELLQVQKEQRNGWIYRLMDNIDFLTEDQKRQT